MLGSERLPLPAQRKTTRGHTGQLSRPNVKLNVANFPQSLFHTILQWRPWQWTTFNFFSDEEVGILHPRTSGGRRMATDLNDDLVIAGEECEKDDRMARPSPIYRMAAKLVHSGTYTHKMISSLGVIFCFIWEAWRSRIRERDRRRHRVREVRDLWQ